MTDQLETSAHDEPQPLTVIRCTQNESLNADGQMNNTKNYDSDAENENPVLLELGRSNSTSTATTTELTTPSYPSDYPLDIHINTPYGISVQHHPPYNHIHGDPVSLYNNPYIDSSSSTPSSHHTHALSLHHHHPLPLTPTNHMSTSPSPVLVSLNNVSTPYSTHIPQTVYTWSTPTPVSSAMTEVGSKLTTDIVPPPIYMSYVDTRELAIRRESNPSWKERALQSEKDYKKTACDRERTRMRDMNRAFDLLRSKLPVSKPNGKKYSKIESLRIAINYISHLQQTLKDSLDPSTSIVNFIKSNENSVDYLDESANLRRRRSQSYHYENEKSSTDTLDNLDESRSTWSDGYIPNSHDKWE